MHIPRNSLPLDIYIKFLPESYKEAHTIVHETFHALGTGTNLEQLLIGTLLMLEQEGYRYTISISDLLIVAQIYFTETNHWTSYQTLVQLMEHLLERQTLLLPLWDSVTGSVFHILDDAILPTGFMDDLVGKKKK